MKALSRYTAALTLVAAITLGSVLPFLGPRGRVGLLIAVAITLPLQIGFFSLLVSTRSDPSRFMALWGLGMLGRLGVLVIVGLSTRIFQGLDPAVTIMSTVGLFFVFVLLEPGFLPRHERTAGYAR
jgi:hypothetical protein